MPKTPTKGSYIKPAVFIDRKPTSRNTRFKAGALADVSSKINRDGLPLLMNHDSGQFPVGMWFQAKVNENDQVIAQFYVPKEIPEHDDIYSRVEAGILDSVSIGFSAGVHDCSICGNDIQDYEACPHIPGRTYEGETAYVELDAIKASEGSLVYAGAVPDAKIQDSYSEDCSKEDYCKSHTFSDGELMIATGGIIVQDNNETFNDEGTPMELKELQEKFSAQAEKLDSVNSKYMDLLEKFNANSAEALKVDEYKAAADEASKEATDAKEAYSAVVATVAEQVKALAAPFEASYEAPTDIEALFADMTKFMEKAKELPSGQQSNSPEDEVVAYVIPEDKFKV